jgi:two-component system chemotaxis sensor kinase CheA
MLRATFRVEASDHLQTLASGLLELEASTTSDDRKRLIDTVFRAAHSLKGAARAVNFTEIESTCQALEDTLARWKKGTETLSQGALDAALALLDSISNVLRVDDSSAVRSARSSPPPLVALASTPASPAVEESVALESVPAVTAERAVGEDTVRIAVRKLDLQLLEAEEMLAAKQLIGQRALELAALTQQLDSVSREWRKIQPHARALRRLPEHTALAEFLDWNHDQHRALENKMAALRRSAEQDRLTIGRQVDDLLADAKRLLMLPLATLGALLPKIVRDLCRDQGKEAKLIIQGDSIEIDKRILEEMKDPLIHLLRNSVDHGVEPPTRRRELGKPVSATIKLSIVRTSSEQVCIEVSDDGAGFDAAQLKATAIKRGLVTQECAQGLDEMQAMELAFESDVSTSPIITRLSGRGLGLAIVRERAQKLGGKVGIESRLGQGTTIRMLLPLTLATFRGVLIAVGGQRFIVPTADIERVGRYRPEDLKTVEGRETIVFGGRTVALVRLTDVLGLPAMTANRSATSTAVVLLGRAEQIVAFEIDAVLDEQEVLVKPFAKPLVRVRNISGATILGSGDVVPVLRVSDLLLGARQAGTPLRAASDASAAVSSATTSPAKRVLLAEDSITSRMLLKGILESAGFMVTTAVDGMDAFTALRTEKFDLLVSDVEMPRLNGFDLTARIRADRKLAELPIVLVTALATRADRERGVEVGANAYLIKSSFDQSNLLDIVRRLL